MEGPSPGRGVELDSLRSLFPGLNHAVPACPAGLSVGTNESDFTSARTSATIPSNREIVFAGDCSVRRVVCIELSRRYCGFESRRGYKVKTRCQRQLWQGLSASAFNRVTRSGRSTRHQLCQDRTRQHSNRHGNKGSRSAGRPLAVVLRAAESSTTSHVAVPRPRQCCLIGLAILLRVGALRAWTAATVVAVRCNQSVSSGLSSPTSP